MTLYVGNDDAVTQKVKKAYIGVDGIGRNIKAMYVGDDNGIARKVFPDGGGSTDVDPEGLTFTSDNPFTLKFAGNNGYSTPANIEMTTNGNDWTSFNSASVITFDSAMNTVTGKHTIAVRADNYINKGTSDAGMPNNYYSFSFLTGNNISVSKSLMYLTGNKSVRERADAFACLFEDCAELIDASNLIFPEIDTQAYNAYYNMFKRCTNLTSVGGFKITYIGGYGCAHMFEECVNLNIPTNKIDSSELINVAGYGCYRMFAYTKVTEPMDLSNLEVANNCSFWCMYYHCTQLRYPANIQKALDVSGMPMETPYGAMYSGCTSLQVYNSGPADLSLDFSNYYANVWDEMQVPSQMFLDCINAPSYWDEPGTPEDTTYYFKKS